MQESGKIAWLGRYRTYIVPVPTVGTFYLVGNCTVGTYLSSILPVRYQVPVRVGTVVKCKQNDVRAFCRGDRWRQYSTEFLKSSNVTPSSGLPWLRQSGSGIRYVPVRYRYWYPTVPTVRVPTIR